MAVQQSEASRIFGERVRAERVRLGLSQEELGQLADIHFTNIGKIERGVSNPSLHTIVRLAGVLDVDPGNFISGMTSQDLPERFHPLTAKEFVQEREVRSPRHTKRSK